MIRATVTTDLPDGARLLYTVQPLLDDPESNGQYIPGSGTVLAGAMEFQADIGTRPWSRAAIIFVEFHMVAGEQPPDVVSVFGENGGRLMGAGIEMNEDGYPIVVAHTTVTLAG